MTPEQYNKIKALGIDPDISDENIFENLLDLATYLFHKVGEEEKERFKKEIRRVLKPTN